MDLSHRLRVGRRNRLQATRLALHGCYLDGLDQGDILLPARYVPRDVRPGDTLDVFVYLDSEDRLVATTEQPLCEVGQVALLRCVDVAAPGAFLDWGLRKDLLVPRREQRSDMRPGEAYVVMPYIDPATGRIAATEKIERELDHTMPTYQPGDRANAIVFDHTQLGYKLALDDRHTAVLYHSSAFQPLALGQRLDVYVAKVRDDDRIDVQLTPPGYAKVDTLAARILDKLREAGGQLDLNDDTPPQRIRDTFGCSKKAFKMTIGTLLRQGRIHFHDHGIALTNDD